MRLIIEADDFGLSESISNGIIDGINGGYITSTNIMANMPFAKYAVKKAIDDAFKNIVKVNIKGTTIAHDVQQKYNSSIILLKPASEGTGVIAGGSVRPVLEMAGIKDILTKSLGSNNPYNVVRATIDALSKVKA